MKKNELRRAADFRVLIVELWERDREEILTRDPEQYVGLFPNLDETVWTQDIVDEAVRGLPYVDHVKRFLPTKKVPYTGWQVFFQAYRVHLKKIS